MFKFLIIILIFVSVNIGISQNNYQDVVYLKNGSIIRGIIIEQIPNQSLKIETKDRNVFVFKFDEIEKLTKEKIADDYYEKNQIEKSETGYLGLIETGYGIGVGDLSNFSNRTNLYFINGYKIHPIISLGLGTGINYYVNERAISNSLTVPLFLDLRINFLPKSNFTPYLVTDIGLNFATNPEFEDNGLFLNTGLGISFHLNKDNNLNLSLTYNAQNENPYTIWIGDYSYYRQTIDFNLGITF